MKGFSSDSVNRVEIGPESDGQRLDNFLARVLKGVPRSHLYRILRSGEVRVNSRRCEASTRLSAGDQVRIPPIRVAERPEGGTVPASVSGPSLPVLFEDEVLLAVDKPAGLAVHGGSGVSHGIIERLRAERPDDRFLELVHRLDRETSGVLLLARRRSALTDLHAQIREGRTDKRYLALVKGTWRGGGRTIDAPLAKYVLDGGERRVSVSSDGQASRTVLRPVRHYAGYTLLEARLLTGRTHQIRVHLAHIGLPICGDDKYGDFALNRELAREGLKRMFLHAGRLQFVHPGSGGRISIESSLAPELAGFLERLSPAEAV